MSIESFKDAVTSLNERIKSEYSVYETGPIMDGALDLEEYFKSNLKIMWLMKEGYGDDFSYPDLFMKEFSKFTKDLVFGGPKNTWQPIVYVTYGILNNYMKFETMDNLKILKDEEIIKQTLNKIVFVNIQKSPSVTGSNTDMRNIHNSNNNLLRNKLLWEQINLLNPKIIICGNTFSVIKNDLGNPNQHQFNSKEEFVHHYIIGDRIYVDPNHPEITQARHQMDKGRYIDDIVRTVKKCLEI